TLSESLAMANLLPNPSLSHSIRRNGPEKCGPAWQWPRNANRLTPRMILPLGVALELGTVKVNFAQISLAVLLGFIIEVRRGGMSALAPRGDGPGSDFVSKF